MNNKAIFFDRDDTLIRDKSYMYKPEDLSFFSDTFDVLLRLQKLNFELFIVTNQSGIGRGIYTEADMHKFNGEMLNQLNVRGIHIKEVVFCPHSPDDACDCRKPSPKLLNQLCDKFQIDKTQSYMIGDKQSDLQAGINAGMKSIQVSDGNIKAILDTIL